MAGNTVNCGCLDQEARKPVKDIGGSPVETSRGQCSEPIFKERAMTRFKLLPLTAMLLVPLWEFRQPNAAGGGMRSGPASPPCLCVEQAVSARVPSDLQFSSDGKRLAFQVSELKPGGSRTLEIWVVDVASRQGRRFAHSSQSDRMPRWSPDGKTVGFLSNRDGTTQVYTIAADGGEAEVLTQGTNAVSDFAWSPDGKQIAFVAPEPNTAAEEKKQKDKDDARVVGTLDKRSRLWTIELATKKVRQLTRDQWDVGEMCWSPAGDRLYIIATENPDSTGFEGRILAVSLPDGALKQVFAPVGPISQLRISRDGGLVSFLGARGDGPIPHDIHVLPVGSSTPRNLTGASLDRQVTSFEWQADGRLLAIAQDGFRWRGVWVTATGNVDPVQELAAHSTILVARAATGVLAFIRQTATELPEVWTLARGGKPERVTHFNDGFPASMLIQPEYYRYRSYDGLDIEAALYRPRARGKTGPAALVAIIGTHKSMGRPLLALDAAAGDARLRRFLPQRTRLDGLWLGFPREKPGRLVRRGLQRHHGRCGRPHQAGYCRSGPAGDRRLVIRRTDGGLGADADHALQGGRGRGPGHGHGI
jgi:hypothetical protein